MHQSIKELHRDEADSQQQPVVLSWILCSSDT